MSRSRRSTWGSILGLEESMNDPIGLLSKKKNKFNIKPIHFVYIAIILMVIVLIIILSVYFSKENYENIEKKIKISNI